jgi:hypothetical protein
MSSASRRRPDSPLAHAVTALRVAGQLEETLAALLGHDELSGALAVQRGKPMGRPPENDDELLARMKELEAQGVARSKTIGMVSVDPTVARRLRRKRGRGWTVIVPH